MDEPLDETQRSAFGATYTMDESSGGTMLQQAPLTGFYPVDNPFESCTGDGTLGAASQYYVPAGNRRSGMC